MDLGLPLDFFIREVLIVATYAVLTASCARYWDRGTWAKVGAIAAALGCVLTAWNLTAFVLLMNGYRGLMDSYERLGTGVIWVDLGVLIGLAAAVLLGRRQRTALVDPPTTPEDDHTMFRRPSDQL